MRNDPFDDPRILSELADMRAKVANIAMRAENLKDANGRPIVDASGNVDLQGADGKVTKAIREIMTKHEDAVHTQEDGVRIHRCDYHSGKRKAHHQHHSA